MSYFKIDSDEHFTELKRFPDGFHSFEFHARILPDRFYIRDMMENYGGYWETIEEVEYERVFRESLR